MAGIFIKNFFAYKTQCALTQKSRYGEGFDLEQTMLMGTCTAYMCHYLPTGTYQDFLLRPLVYIFVTPTTAPNLKTTKKKKKKHAQAHVPFSIAGKPLYRDPDCL